MNYHRQKCAIIGCGFVGATTAFTFLKSGLFSEIVLIDQDVQRAQGEAMDLQHSNPFIRPVNIYAGTYEHIGDCSLIVISAGANQKPNETRMDLIHKNVAILKSIIPQITAKNDHCILLIVTNPVDVLTYAALKLSGFPPHRVIGSGTVLDTARLKYLLGEQLAVDSRNVHAFIIGEHGDTELPVWSSANISGVDIAAFCEERNPLQDGKGCRDMSCIEGIYQEVRDSAYQIIEKKGATYYAISLATLRIAEAILRDENSVLPVSTLAGGHYGLEDLCLSLPSVVGREGVKQVLDIPLDAKEQKLLEKSALALKTAIQEIRGEL